MTENQAEFSVIVKSILLFIKIMITNYTPLKNSLAISRNLDLILNFTISGLIKVKSVFSVRGMLMSVWFVSYIV